MKVDSVRNLFRRSHQRILNKLKKPGKCCDSLVLEVSEIKTSRMRWRNRFVLWLEVFSCNWFEVAFFLSFWEGWKVETESAYFRMLHLTSS